MEYRLTVGFMVGITIIFLGIPLTVIWNFPWIAVAGFAICGICILPIAWLAVLQTKPKNWK